MKGSPFHYLVVHLYTPLSISTFFSISQVTASSFSPSLYYSISQSFIIPSICSCAPPSHVSIIASVCPHIPPSILATLHYYTSLSLHQSSLHLSIPPSFPLFLPSCILLTFHPSTYLHIFILPSFHPDIPLHHLTSQLLRCHPSFLPFILPSFPQSILPTLHSATIPPYLHAPSCIPPSLHLPMTAFFHPSFIISSSLSSCLSPCSCVHLSIQLIPPSLNHPCLVIHLFLHPSIFDHTFLCLLPIYLPLFLCFSPSFHLSLFHLFILFLSLYSTSSPLCCADSSLSDNRGHSCRTFCHCGYVLSLFVYLSPCSFKTSHVTAALRLVLSAGADVTLLSPFTLSLPVMC